MTTSERILNEFQNLLDVEGKSLSRSDYRRMLEECIEECQTRLDALDEDEAEVS